MTPASNVAPPRSHWPRPGNLTPALASHPSIVAWLQPCSHATRLVEPPLRLGPVYQSTPLLRLSWAFADADATATQSWGCLVPPLGPGGRVTQGSRPGPCRRGQRWPRVIRAVIPGVVRAPSPGDGDVVEDRADLEIGKGWPGLPSLSGVDPAVGTPWTETYLPPLGPSISGGPYGIASACVSRLASPAALTGGAWVSRLGGGLRRCQLGDGGELGGGH